MKRSKIGKFMYKLTMACGKFLSRHMWIYYILIWTWGFIMSFVGLLISLIMLITGHKPKKYHGIWCFMLKNKDFGISFGTTFLACDESVCPHEYGHTFQNAIFGPLFIFLIALPSGIRYWYRELKFYRKGKNPTTDYDAIWFEGSATDLGKYIISEAKNNENK